MTNHFSSQTQEYNNQLTNVGIKVGIGTKIWGQIDLQTRETEIGKWSVIGGKTFVATHCPYRSMVPGGLKTIIGDYVWIGYGCIIVPGVTIGNRSLIGAGSVVVKDIPPDVIAAGNPAKVIRSRDKKEIIRTYLINSQKGSLVYQEPDWSLLTDLDIMEIFQITQEQFNTDRKKWMDIIHHE